MMILPRQARDKHRENSKKRPFCCREWLVKEHVMGASSGGMDGMANPNVTGFCERRDA